MPFTTDQGVTFTLFVKNNFNMWMSIFMNPVCVIYNLLGCELVISIRSLSVCDSPGQECQTLPLEYLSSLQESCNYTVLQFIMRESQ